MEQKLELELDELFQLHLCIVARVGAVQIEWTNVKDNQEQKYKEQLLEYLTRLDKKVLEIGAKLKKEEPKEETNDVKKES